MQFISFGLRCRSEGEKIRPQYAMEERHDVVAPLALVSRLAMVNQATLIKT